MLLFELLIVEMNQLFVVRNIDGDHHHPYQSTDQSLTMYRFRRIDKPNHQ